MEGDMNDPVCASCTSRREFLKQACKATGYIVPLVVGFKLGSLDAWAADYGRSTNTKETTNTHCNSTIEKIFNPSCW